MGRVLGWLVGVVVMAMLVGGGMARAQSEINVVADDAPSVLLWPGGAPGAKGTALGDKPSLTVYLPATNPTGTGVVIAPGGGYADLAMVHEGYAEGRWLADHGIAAFVLRYRLGPVYHAPVEQDDAKRAMRLVRARAAEFGVRTDRIGMMGFSAGGHLAAMTGTVFDGGNAGAADGIERQGSRPDFLVLGYPVITMEGAETHRGSRTFLLGEHPTAAEEKAYSADQRVTGQTPPTFLFATTDDMIVPVRDSVMFYSALVGAGVSAEMHLFAHGDHGFGMAVGNPELGVWPELMLRWMRGRGLAGVTQAAGGK